MATVSNEPLITLYSNDRRVRIVIDATLLANTNLAIELRERGYPPRHYMPREDVLMYLLPCSGTVAYYPFKGNSVYFTFSDQVDMAWSSERSFKGWNRFTTRLAF